MTRFRLLIALALIAVIVPLTGCGSTRGRCCGPKPPASGCCPPPPGSLPPGQIPPPPPSTMGGF